MSSKRSLTQHHLESVLQDRTMDDLIEAMRPDLSDIPRPYTPISSITPARAKRLWKELNQAPDAQLFDAWTVSQIEHFSGNIENCIGSIKLPLGIAGPLRVNGLFAKGDYPIPLATSEAALVASYHRGCSLLTAVGGCTAMLAYQSVNRSPAFTFKNLSEAGQFVAWAIPLFDQFKQIAESTTSHGKLHDVGITLEGNHAYLNFEYTTGDASGQNMVTIATQAICDFIQQNYTGAIQQIYVEGNLSGDKKASAQSYTTVRGKKVTAEAIIPSELLKKYLHTTPKQMLDYWTVSAIGGVLSGTMGIHGHFANGLAALYIATGQDAACVAESAMGVTRFDLTEHGDLYATVSLPGIMVGTVGGGTDLPSQKSCLELMGLHGRGKSGALAEICGALLLAGELSIIAALATGDFTRAHKKLAR